MRAKPWDMKYTDLCIYIDKTIYERDSDGNPIALRKLSPEEIDNVYTYLYDLIYALSVKKRLFTNKHDYDSFCLEAAGDIFMRLEKPDQDFSLTTGHNKPIKSVLNYIKGALGFMSITWRNNNYSQVLNPGHDSAEDLEGARNYLYDRANVQFEEQKSQAYRELLQHLPEYLDKGLNNSIYKKNKLKRYELLISQYASLCNCLTIENKKNSYPIEKKQAKILEQVANRKNFIVSLSEDPIITPDLVELQLKRGFFLLEDEANKITHDLTPSDEEIDNILASAFSTYDTDQSGGF